MDFGNDLLKPICKLVVQFLNISFQIFDYKVSVAALLIFGALVSLALWFLRGMSD